MFIMYSCSKYVQDEVDLYLAAHSGDVSAVRQLVAANVNVDCIPITVCDSIATSK